MKTFEVIVRTLVTMRVVGPDTKAADQSVRERLGPNSEIVSVIQIDPPLDPDAVCPGCEEQRVKDEKDPPTPPKGAPPTGSPTGGTTPSLLQEAA